MFIRQFVILLAASPMFAGVTLMPIPVSSTPTSLYSITGTRYASRITLTAIADASIDTQFFVGTSGMDITTMAGVGAMIEPSPDGFQPDSLTLMDPSGYAGLDLSTVYLAGEGGALSAVIEVGTALPGNNFDYPLSLTFAGQLVNASSSAPLCRALSPVTIVSKVPGQEGRTFIGDSTLASWGTLTDDLFDILPDGIPVARLLNPFPGGTAQTHIDRWTFRVPYGEPYGGATGNYCVFNEFSEFGEYALGLEFSRPSTTPAGATVATSVGFSGRITSLAGSTAFSVPIALRITYPAGQEGKVFLGTSSMNTDTGTGVFRDMGSLNGDDVPFEVWPNAAVWQDMGQSADPCMNSYELYSVPQPTSLSVYAMPEFPGLVVATESMTQASTSQCGTADGPPIAVNTFDYGLASFSGEFDTVPAAIAPSDVYVEWVEVSTRLDQYGYQHVAVTSGDVAQLHNDLTAGDPTEVYKIQAPPTSTGASFDLNQLLVYSDYAAQQMNIVAGYYGSSIPTSSTSTLTSVVGGQVASFVATPTAIAASATVSLATFQAAPGNWVKVGLFGPGALAQPDATYTSLGVLTWPNVESPDDNYAHSQRFDIGWGSTFDPSGLFVAGFSDAFTNGYGQGLLVGIWQAQ